MSGKDEIVHPHERAGRAEKVAALVVVIDRYNERIEDHHLRIDAELVGGVTENDAFWRVLAGIAGVRLPSLTTRQHVEGYLRARAEGAARLARGEDPFEGLL